MPEFEDGPVDYPIDGTLDLHTFNPSEVGDLVNDYIEACLEKGIYELRIIHGKGTGTLRRIVQSVLEKHPAVKDYRPEGDSGGGWGATVVDLRKA
jgi:dsDNA-specific endonuclease/ATPase MutS2